MDVVFAFIEISPLQTNQGVTVHLEYYEKDAGRPRM